jgi:hypothetical protein
MKNKVYIKNHEHGAGRWIYSGYKRAWESLGYDAIYYSSLSEIKEGEEYYLMAMGGDVTNDSALDALKNSVKTFLYVQPNEFPSPWGLHANFKCHCPLEYIEKINKLDNVHLWAFGNTNKYHTEWKAVNYIPLAFDHLGYVPQKDARFEFDVCFVGGWADNGFNEKKAIMLNHFTELEKLGIKLGIAINQGISDQDEANLLYNSKISLNIHDAYQRKLGLDSNERTFKSLGLTGFLVCDDVQEVRNLFPTVPIGKDPQSFAALVQEYLNKDLSEDKKTNRDMILNNHTYVHRVNALLEL